MLAIMTPWTQFAKLTRPPLRPGCVARLVLDPYRGADGSRLPHGRFALPDPRRRGLIGDSPPERFPSNPERVVLLGARGFIAQALRRELEGRGIPWLRLTAQEIDLCAAEAAKKPLRPVEASDAVVMLSALTPDKGRDAATLMKNLAMMQNVCIALENAPCAQLVYFSSDAVYDPAVARVTEETPASPQDLYGSMHLTREIMARALGKIPLAYCA
ncbi:MAG: NAD-dependent epimerase/dehydratase family protein [Betaproteobacteria bacterium]|nr:NAD-dependent epimerase/dehydratase family protein [Betaproteobacteria bacterium]